MGKHWDFNYKKLICNLFVKSANWIYSFYLYHHINKNSE